MFRFFVLGFVGALLWFYSLPTLSAWPMVWSLVGIVLLFGLLVGVRFIRDETIKQIVSAVIQIIIQGFIGALVAFLLSFCVEKTTSNQSLSSFNALLTTLPAVQFANQNNELNPVIKPTAKQTFWVEGRVLGLPETGQSTFGKSYVKFIVEIDHIQSLTLKKLYTPAWQIFAPKIKLSWYDNAQVPQEGEVWRFKIKLKPNHASLNPGAFDYERYLFQQHIAATGYVLSDKQRDVNRQTVVAIKEHSNAQLLDDRGAGSLRSGLAKHLAPWFDQSQFGGIYRALIYGDKSHITAEQWLLFRQTGTIHLMAISGLHIGILAAIGFTLFGGFWRLGVRYRNWVWLRQLPKIWVGSVGAVIFALFYMALAGFAIPTVRAGLMVLSLLVFGLIRRRFQPWSALALAAFIILLLDSRSVLSSGFWLSFIAVAIIYGVIATKGFQTLKKWQQLLALQLALTLGMMPVLALMYQQIPIVSWLANLIAVPLVSLIGLPLLMLTVALSWLPSDWVTGLMMLNDELWQGLWWCLNRLESLSQTLSISPSGFWTAGGLAIWQVVLFYFVLALCLSLPRLSGKIKILSAVVLIIGFMVWTVFRPISSELAVGSFKVTVLDVGQGQALVFETRNHTVVYDTGPKWNDSLDGASMAILPYLAHENRNQVDLLMVSHSDMDHAGGTQTLLNNVTVQQAVSGQAKRLNEQISSAVRFSPCLAGQSWTFDRVHFQVLSPQQTAYENDNDASCVLKVSTDDDVRGEHHSQTVIVTGDASQKIEKKLVTAKVSVQAQILVAGHHGSQTATSDIWLQAVRPQMVVFSAGYRNRFDFPNEKVISRVEKMQIRWLNTACSGAIQFRINPTGWRVENRQRLQHSTWVNHQCSMGDKWQKVLP